VKSAASFSPLDLHFATLMERLCGKAAPEVHLAARLTSYFRGLGHVCLPLRELRAERLPVDAGRLPSVTKWIRALRAAPVVGAPGDRKPLILDEAGRLYLHQYWSYEQRLASDLRARLTIPETAVDRERLAGILDAHFPPSAEPDWQRLAAFVALTRNFCVISGGPGTGKTRTVVRLLAALIELLDPVRLRIALAAPTGKAAARLKQSVQAARDSMPPLVQERLPTEATTIHRLLGILPGSPRFRRDPANLLPFDVVVVDEASMVDLAMMAKLVDAIPRTTRLILLGDRNQLTSVEAGAVLGDLCHSGEEVGLSENIAASYQKQTGLGFAVPTRPAVAPMHEAVVELCRNYRFHVGGGIAELSRLINAGDAAAVAQMLKSQDHPDIRTATLPSPAALSEKLREIIGSGYRAHLAAADPAEALAAFEQFRVLTPLRHGPFGINTLNTLIEQTLMEAGLIEKSGPWYHGRPVMITRNDYNLRLFNGDIGLAIRDPELGQMRVAFSTAEGTIRHVLPARLPSHETAFAMTVHKSQGSEWDRVLLLVPDVGDEFITRELLYTGITRARTEVSFWYREEGLRNAVSRRIWRSSGLRDALWPASREQA
jgi:exodeoxyribonuclease V alpha subunit